VRSFQHPLPGPAGEALHCDVAAIGPTDASAVHLLIAGTHGVEGFLGSAVLTDLLLQAPTSNVRMLLVHGINPWGYANLSRFTENNVDLNRNFIDFSAGVPGNDGYHRLHRAICPSEWTEDSLAAFRAALVQHDFEHGAGKGLDATLRGQYSHTDGFNFGGTGPEWSHLCLRSICDDMVGDAEAVLVTDWHTGLGKRAENVIIPYAPGGQLESRTMMRFGLGNVVPVQGFPAYTGLVTEGVRRFVPHASVVGLLVEFGIDDDPWVNVDGLRYDRWLRFGDSGGIDIDKARAGLRDLYCPPDASWRRSAIEDARRLNMHIAKAAQ